MPMAAPSLMLQLAAMIVATCAFLTPPELPQRIRPATEEELRIAREARDAQRASAVPTTAHVTPRGDPAPWWSDLQPVPRVLDFGEMIAGRTERRTLVLVNVGDEPITIIRAVPSGSGPVPPAPKSPIPPNCVGEVEIRLTPPQRQGLDLRKKLTVQLEDRPPVVVEYVAHVAEYIRVCPEVIETPPTPPEAPRGIAIPAPRRIAVEATDGRAFRITAVRGVDAIIPTAAASRHELTLGDPPATSSERPTVIEIDTDRKDSRETIRVVVLEW
jgi:hypothetical protein